MRRFTTALVCSLLVAFSFGAFTRLIAEARTSVSHAAASLTRAGESAASHALLLGADRVPVLGRLFGRLQKAQSPVAAKNPNTTVETDKSDYHPNEQVLISGAGWLPRELVELTITEVATDPPGGWTDGPFIYYATSDRRGNIANGDFWTDEHDGGVSFLLVAKGVISGRTAQTTFTDSLGNLDQCANGNPLDPTPCQSAAEWVNGNLGASKSTYLEGDSIPYRMTMSGLTLGTHTVTIEWDTTKAGKHALDYITTFNRSVAANPCAGVAGCGSPTTFAIPLDPNLAPVTPVAGNFTLYNGTITSVSAYTLSGTYAGDSSTRIQITFTNSSASPVLAWGGHIATRLDWGAGGSAVAISGSPYHTRLIEIDGAGGNQDRSLSADAVIFPAKITIVKDAVPDNALDFAFTTTGGLSPATFPLDDDPTDATLSNTKAYANILNFTTYTVAETAVSGWALTFGSPVCTVASANGGSQSASSNTITINLKEGEDVSCKFTNTLVQPTLKLIKLVTNDNGGSKQVSDFVLKVDTTQVTSGVAVGVTVGSHTASEVNVPGYSASSWTGDCAANGSVSLAPGENKTCTITNDDVQPHLTLVKTVTNDHGGTKQVSDFVLKIDSTTVASGASTAVSAGAHTASEVNLPGYQASAWGGDCAANGTITLQPGDSKTCTITNDDVQPHLTLVKTVTNDHGGTKQVSDFVLKIDSTTVTSGASNAVSAGLHTASEVNLPGYQASAWGGDCAANGTITLQPGDSKTCTITNDDVQPHLTLVKSVTNDSGGTKQVSDFVLKIDSTTVTSSASNAVNAGLHTASEVNLPGYQASAWGGDCAANGTITLQPGDNKTCTITNDDVQPHLTLVKTVTNDHGGTKQVSDFVLKIDSTTVASGASTAVSAGAHTASEVNLPGYQASAWGGDCAANGTITLQPGDNKTCTITNDDVQPHLTLVKTVTNDNGGTKQVSDFVLKIDSTTVTSSASNAVNAGLHTASEVNLPGYQASAWGGDCAANGTITLQPGDNKTCTITNDDQTATLTVIKHVVNDNGGTKAAADFTMNVSGTNVQPLPSFPGAESPGTTVTLNAGGYSVDETAVSGYTKSIGANCSGSIANGETRICTITNSDDKATPGITSAMSWVLKDSATLSNFRTGASDNASATMVFTLYGPNALCNTTAIHTETITGIPTAGPFKTPNGWEVTVPGTYRWLVSYSGDANNNSIASNCGDETHTIMIGEPPPPQP